MPPMSVDQGAAIINDVESEGSRLQAETLPLRCPQASSPLQAAKLFLGFFWAVYSGVMVSVRN